MMSIFDRYLGIDWSGAGSERQPVDLRVAEVSRQFPARRIVPPPRGQGRA